MARQTTLFGTVAKKGHFFTDSLISDDKDGYYAIVEALWTLDKSTDRTTFFTRAQKEWKAGNPLQSINAGIQKMQSPCEFGCKYVFASKRDEDRHHHLVHPAELRAKQREKRKPSNIVAQAAKKTCCRCTFEGCDMSFTSYNQMSQHKKQEGHKLQRGRPILARK